MLYDLQRFKNILYLIFFQIVMHLSQQSKLPAGAEADLSLATAERKSHSSFKFKKASLKS